MIDLKAREVAVALSQILISFHKGRRASARTPITVLIHLEIVSFVTILYVFRGITLFPDFYTSQQQV
jgi:hypothetical protein